MLEPAMNSDLNPVESVLSVSDDHFHTLFENDGTISPAATALAPPSVIEADASRSGSSQPEVEKKPAKKRKSWGQELPTPKTNLPPRKRAKTEDEKEQRRIERVLRNRAAAQSSRERKRKEVEGLEEEKEIIRRQNALLTTQLRRVEMENQELSKTIAKMAAEMSVFRQMIHGDLPTSHGGSKVVSPTLSADLIPSNEPVPNLKEELADLDFALPPPQSTVDPREASFSSPSGSPKMDSISTASVLDSTQHPAEMLCDLQCQSGNLWLQWSNLSDKFSTEAENLASLSIFLTMSHLLLVTMASTASSLLIQPLAEIFHSLKTGCPISMAVTSSAETLLPLIRWLISTPTNPLSNSAKTMSSSTTSTNGSHRRPQPIFRINLLRRLLACSPTLARPLRDATGRALRLMSSGESTRKNGLFVVEGTDSTGVGDMEFLMTMLWVIDSIDREKGRRVVQHGDPSTEIRRLCVALDELFPGEHHHHHHHHHLGSIKAAKVTRKVGG